MRTPTVMIIGMVMAPCGLVLNLTSTVAPAWRSLSSLVNRPTDVILNQGIWDICEETTTNQDKQCGVTDNNYFSQQVVQVARALMIVSLVVNALGIALASWGVRCWEEVPNFLISAFGGMVIFISGVLSLIPIAWYNNLMYTMPTSVGQQNTYVGYALVLGYLGSCLEIIGGFSLMLCFVPPCKKCIKNKGKPTSSMYYSKKQTPYQEKPTSHVYSVQNSAFPSHDLRYSIENDNYRHGKKTISVVSSPRSYTNSMDVTAGEHPRSYGRPGSQLSSLPCDSDLL
ncbi:claudin-23 [Bufo gargarizans]|uniref:claudin-23 n=1 Tax=Bufo gargarizans TaxID=30331 RepID=UPI001CF23533|nr:claudin-23 [Bufo gargarizans]